MKTSAPERNVLVAVDVQNDFVSGSLAVNGGEAIVQPLNELAQAVRDTGGNVAFTRDWHPPVTPHFDTWPVHCVADTDGADFHPDLRIFEDDIVISKGMEQNDGYSGWEGQSDTGITLESIVEPQTLEEKVNLFIGGLATDYCVQATALDIAERFKDDNRVQLFLIRDAIRAVNLAPTDELRALDAMKAASFFAVSCQEAKVLVEESVR